MGITSTAYKGERSLAFTIVSGSTSSGKYTSPGEKFDIDSSENVIKLATKLFGGFSSEDAVYKKLKKELGRKNTTQTTHDGEVYVIHKWKCDIDGISCEIKFTQPDKDKDEMYLYTIMFMTDPELYEQRNLQRIKDLNINVN